MVDEVVEPEAEKAVAPTKEELEREKLLLEIQKLKDPWWKNPAYILAALPTLLAVLTVIYGFANGYFQATATRLENQKHDLQIQRDKLEADVKEFAATKEELRRENEVLRYENQELLRKQENLKKMVEDVINKLLSPQAISREQLEGIMRAPGETNPPKKNQN